MATAIGDALIAALTPYSTKLESMYRNEKIDPTRKGLYP